MTTFLAGKDGGKWINLAAIGEAHPDVEAGERIYRLYDLSGKPLGNCREYQWENATRPLIPDHTGAKVWVVAMEKDGEFWEEEYPVLAWRCTEFTYLEPVTYWLTDAMLLSTRIIEMPESFGEWRWFNMNSEDYYTNKQTAIKAAREYILKRKAEAEAKKDRA